MKIFISCTFIMFTYIGFTQRDTLHIHYFPNGKVSTYSYLEENKEGKALAYNFKGEVIYEKGTRLIYGSAGVRFTHHENGMVKVANYSSHPDGGIQWYRSTTTFDDKGNKIKYTEDNYEGPGRNPIFIPYEPFPPVTPDSPPTKKIEPKKEVVTCASIHENLVEVINHTKFKIEVTFIYQNKDTIIVLDKGEKIEGPTFISAEVSRPVHENMTFRFEPIRKRKNVIELIESKQIQQNKTKHKIHLFESLVSE